MSAAVSIGISVSASVCVCAHYLLQFLLNSGNKINCKEPKNSKSQKKKNRAHERTTEMCKNQECTQKSDQFTVGKNGIEEVNKIKSSELTQTFIHAHIYLHSRTDAQIKGFAL